jgi:hypothetical protein
MYLKEIGWDGVDWIHLAQDRVQWGGPCELGNDLSSSTIMLGSFE